MFLKIIDWDFYSIIHNHNFSLQELLKLIESKFPNALMNKRICDNFDYHGFTYTIASLLFLYNQRDSSELEYEQGVLPTSKESGMTLVCSVFTREILQEALIYCRQEHLSFRFSIVKYMERIDLYEVIS